jgi:predicted MPP superfamily phosphohydrolase
MWASFRVQIAMALGLVALLAALFVAAGWILAAALVRRLKRRPAPRRLRWVRRTVLVLGAAAALCIAYAIFVEPYWLEVTHVTVPTAKLPAGGPPIRIVHISDLHCESSDLAFPLDRIVAELKPDLIAFTGDGFNSPRGLEKFRAWMRRLSHIAPTFAVQGNWDRRRWVTRFVEGTGVRELAGEAAKVHVAGTELYLVGAPAGNWPAVQAALAALPPGALKIVLYHYPDEIPAAADLGVDLFLAGHTHGGQVALPFFGAVVTLSSTGKRFEAGLYHVRDTYAYVSRGIGMEGGYMPRVRFLARPEVTLIELVPTSR